MSGRLTKVDLDRTESHCGRTSLRLLAEVRRLRGIIAEHVSGDKERLWSDNPVTDFCKIDRIYRMLNEGLRPTTSKLEDEAEAIREEEE